MSDLSHINPAAESSPIEGVLRELEQIDPKWRIEVGDPGNLQGWIPGVAFARTEGPFRALLERIANRLGTRDKRTVAVSFALRFGWCASVAIAPFIVHQCVPDVVLENIALKFREDTLFERTALLSPRGVMVRDACTASHPLVRYEINADALLQVLREQLNKQALPVVEALYECSGFSRKGAWGMITSSWASQFINVCGHLS